MAAVAAAAMPRVDATECQRVVKARCARLRRRCRSRVRCRDTIQKTRIEKTPMPPRMQYDTCAVRYRWVVQRAGVGGGRRRGGRAGAHSRETGEVQGDRCVCKDRPCPHPGSTHDDELLRGHHRGRGRQLRRNDELQRGAAVGRGAGEAGRGGRGREDARCGGAAFGCEQRPTPGASKRRLFPAGCDSAAPHSSGPPSSSQREEERDHDAQPRVQVARAHGEDLGARGESAGGRGAIRRCGWMEQALAPPLPCPPRAPLCRLPRLLLPPTPTRPPAGPGTC